MKTPERDGVERKGVEDMGEEGAPGLGRVALAPMGPAEPVAEFALVADAGEPDPADQPVVEGDGQRTGRGCRACAHRGEKRLGIAAPIREGHAGEHSGDVEVRYLGDEPVDIAADGGRRTSRGVSMPQVRQARSRGSIAFLLRPRRPRT